MSQKGKNKNENYNDEEYIEIKQSNNTITPYTTYRHNQRRGGISSQDFKQQGENKTLNEQPNEAIDIHLNEIQSSDAIKKNGTITGQRKLIQPKLDNYNQFQYFGAPPGTLRTPINITTPLKNQFNPDVSEGSNRFQEKQPLIGSNKKYGEQLKTSTELNETEQIRAKIHNQTRKVITSAIKLRSTTLQRELKKNDNKKIHPGHHRTNTALTRPHPPRNNINSRSHNQKHKREQFEGTTDIYNRTTEDLKLLSMEPGPETIRRRVAAMANATLFLVTGVKVGFLKQILERGYLESYDHRMARLYSEDCENFTQSKAEKRKAQREEDGGFKRLSDILRGGSSGVYTRAIGADQASCWATKSYGVGSGAGTVQLYLHPTTLALPNQKYPWLASSSDLMGRAAWGKQDDKPRFNTYITTVRAYEPITVNEQVFYETVPLSPYLVALTCDDENTFNFCKDTLGLTKPKNIIIGATKVYYVDVPCGHNHSAPLFLTCTQWRAKAKTIADLMVYVEAHGKIQHNGKTDNKINIW